MSVWRTKRPQITVEGLATEFNKALDLYEIPRASFMMELITGKSNVPAKAIRAIKDGAERRRTIVTTLIENGVIPQHKADYLKRTLGFNTKLNEYYEGK